VDDVALWLQRVWRQGTAVPARPPAPAGAEV